LTGKIVVVTGGANGIGKALCEPFTAAGAAKVIGPISTVRAHGRYGSVDGAASKCDVAKEKDVLHVIEERAQFGPIALFCSNAGIGGGFDPLSVNAGAGRTNRGSEAGDPCDGACLCRAASARASRRAAGAISSIRFPRPAVVAGR